MENLTCKRQRPAKAAAASTLLLSCALGWVADAAPGIPGAPETGRLLPWVERFDSTKLDTGWTVHAAAGNLVEVSNGVVSIARQPGTCAHLERKLARDMVRVSGTLRSIGPAGTASLCVWWDASNFAQIGLNREGGRRLEARVALGTYPHDPDLGPWTPGRWQSLAIEVAQDCIRFLASEDGTDFRCLHVSRRPERLSRAPTLLVIGQDAETKLFPPANPWIQPEATNTLHRCEVDEVRMTALDRNRERASRAERKRLAENERDVSGEKELSGPADPSFESVSRYFPALKWPREAIGIKDNPFAIGVAADGSLQFSADIANYKKPVASFSVDGYQFGSGPTACAKRLLNRYMPIIVAKDQRDGLELEQTAFGYSKDFSADETLYAYVRLQITNAGNTNRSVDLSYRVCPASGGAPPLSWRLELPARAVRAVQVRVPASAAFPSRVGTSLAGTLSTVTVGATEEISLDDFNRALGQTGSYWEKLISVGSRFEIPETRVQDAYHAWIAYNFLNVSKRGEVFHVCDGSGFYSQVYGYSAALFCNNLDLLGYHDLSATYFDSLMMFVQTNGLLAVNFGDTDTGAALWAMSEHYRITRDAAWLRCAAPKMLAMCDWIIKQRQRFQETSTNHPAITKGLIRYRPYADMLHPAADYFSNGYLCKGMAATAGVLAEIGLGEAAARLRQESERYRKDILASMDRAVFRDQGMRILPAIPDTRELWKEANGSANGYYGIIVPCMLEAGLPAWNDPKAGLLVEALEQRGGLVAGVARFHNMADHAYAYGYWIHCLQRDEVRKAILGLYGSMAYGMSRDTYSAVECTHIQTGENYWTLPHTYSNTQQLRLLRNLLVREDGERLWLAQAVPRPWLSPGKRVAVNGAPTAFGPVSYSIEVQTDGSMRVRLDPPIRQAPAEILLRLRHPDHRKIARVEKDKPAGLTITGETLRLKHPAEPVELTIIFK